MAWHGTQTVLSAVEVEYGWWRKKRYSNDQVTVTQPMGLFYDTRIIEFITSFNCSKTIPNDIRPSLHSTHTYNDESATRRCFY